MRRLAGPRGRNAAVRSARQQRRSISPPELALWSVLKTRPDGLKVRRQHPIGNDLSLDFYCNDARLCVEVDGQAHGMGDGPARDERRNAFLAVHGIATLRVPAIECLRNLDGVVMHVLTRVRARLPLHHPAAPGGPPPRDELGEDEEDGG